MIWFLERLHEVIQIELLVSLLAFRRDVIRGRLCSSRRNQDVCRDIVHDIRMSIMDR